MVVGGRPSAIPQEVACVRVKAEVTVLRHGEMGVGVKSLGFPKGQKMSCKGRQVKEAFQKECFFFIKVSVCEEMCFED